MRYLIAVVVLAGITGVAAQIPPPAARPDLRTWINLEKTRYAVGEELFLWAGIRGDRAPVRGPEFEERRLITTRPDGSERVDSYRDTSYLLGGIQNATYVRGRMRLPEPPSQLGRYVVVYEVAGIRSEPVSFTVEDVDLHRRVTGEFLIPSPLDLDAADAMVTFVVRNGTGERIWFPQLAQIGSVSGVWFQLTGTGDVKFQRSSRVPPGNLRAASGATTTMAMVDILTWSTLEHIATVSLAPGATYELDIPLLGALDPTVGSQLSPVPPGEYEIRFGTELQVLLGEADGPLRDFSPVRLQVASVGKAVKK